MKTQPDKDKPVSRPRKSVDTSTYSGRFAVRLRELRDKTGMSVPELAEKTKISRANIFAWENNTRTPTINYLPILAKTFKISIARLLPKE